MTHPIVLMLLHRSVALCAVLVAMMALPLAAQSDYSGSRASSGFSAGVFFEGGLSHSFNGLEGFENSFGSQVISRVEDEEMSPIFAFRSGALLIYPFDPTISGTLALGIDQRGMKATRNVMIFFPDTMPTLTNVNTDRINYFAITPGIKISMFHFGLNIGLPLGGTHITPDSTSDYSSEDKENLILMIEPRIGAIFPLMDSEIGWLGLTLNAGYSLSSAIKKANAQGQTVDSPYQFATLHAGLTWQFALGGSRR
jgi:hypothetical protein